LAAARDQPQGGGGKSPGGGHHLSHAGYDLLRPLNAKDKYVLKDLWTKTKLPVAEQLRFEIPADGVAFLKYERAE
jgi:hypothetical protein